MVERTAHNGLVVGSNPTKPKFLFQYKINFMKFNFKDYKIIKTKNFIQKNTIVFFLNGTNKTSSDWILIEQNLTKFNYYKVFNKVAYKTIKNSIFKNFLSTINGITFLVKPSSTTNNLTKRNVLQKFEPLLFYILAVKFNNKIYKNKQLKNLFYLNYIDNKLITFKFCTANTKLFFKKSK